MKSNFKLFALVAGSVLTFGTLQPSIAETGSTTASVPALTPGMVAPTIDVGSSEVLKGTVQ